VKDIIIILGFILILVWAVTGVALWMPVCWYKAPAIISVVFIGAALMFITLENID